jgi:CRISPR/Cas system-associated endonuclease/helicase Cas3
MFHGTAMETAPRRKKGHTLHTLVAPAGCGKTIAALLEFNGSHVWNNKILSRRMLKKTVQQGRSE